MKEKVFTLLDARPGEWSRVYLIPQSMKLIVWDGYILAAKLQSRLRFRTYFAMLPKEIRKEIRQYPKKNIPYRGATISTVIYDEFHKMYKSWKPMTTLVKPL